MPPFKPLKAYEDIDFLKRDELRAVRLQTELLKAQIEMDDAKIHSTVCVFGSARILSPEIARKRLEDARVAFSADPTDDTLARELRIAESHEKQSVYYAMAREFARLISRLGQTRNHDDGGLEYVVMTGGGPGIMEAANRGATDVDAKSIGLNITLPHEQYPNVFITPELSFMFHYFSIRKMHFLLRAKALIVFPGGFGTMDELFETLTLIQTGKTPRIPVVLYGREFWERLVDWDYFVECGVISPEDLSLFRFVESPEEGVRKILEYYGESHPSVEG